MTAVGYEGAVEINAFFAGMIALGVVFSAYCSEVLLSAFKAIPRGQYEAGYALGPAPWPHHAPHRAAAAHPRRPCPASAISGWRS